jgi:hypothetical protein
MTQGFPLKADSYSGGPGIPCFYGPKVYRHVKMKAYHLYLEPVQSYFSAALLQRQYYTLRYRVYTTAHSVSSEIIFRAEMHVVMSMKVTESEYKKLQRECTAILRNPQ